MGFALLVLAVVVAGYVGWIYWQTGQTPTIEQGQSDASGGFDALIAQDWFYPAASCGIMAAIVIMFWRSLGGKGRAILFIAIGVGLAVAFVA